MFIYYIIYLESKVPKIPIIILTSPLTMKKLPNSEGSDQTVHK